MVLRREPWFFRVLPSSQALALHSHYQHSVPYCMDDTPLNPHGIASLSTWLIVILSSSLAPQIKSYPQSHPTTIIANQQSILYFYLLFRSGLGSIKSIFWVLFFDGVGLGFSSQLYIYQTVNLFLFWLSGSCLYHTIFGDVFYETYITITITHILRYISITHTFDRWLRP